MLLCALTTHLKNSVNASQICLCKGRKLASSMTQAHCLHTTPESTQSSSQDLTQNLWDPHTPIAQVPLVSETSYPNEKLGLSVVLVSYPLSPDFIPTFNLQSSRAFSSLQAAQCFKKGGKKSTFAKCMEKQPIRVHRLMTMRWGLVFRCVL